MLQVYADVHVHPVCVVTRFLVVVVVVVVVVTDSSQMMTVCPYRVEWCFSSVLRYSHCAWIHTQESKFSAADSPLSLN